MAFKTKTYYAERIVNGLQVAVPDIDWKIDQRDIFTQLDAVVNAEAKAGFLSNWKAGMPGVSENFITTWEGLEVTDQANSAPSYFTLPVNFADLPGEQGIQEVWPTKWQPDGKNHSVVILEHRDVRLMANTLAGNFQLRLAGYPQSDKFYFTTCDVKKKYGTMNIRLVVRDSSIISTTEPYPIPADREEDIIQRCIDFFRQKRMLQPDKVRDKQDQP
jgi:hypothetical protein